MKTAVATRADRDLVDRLNGLFVGQLSEDELESFERCIVSGYARRKYEGGAGLMGLAKVSVKREVFT